MVSPIGTAIALVLMLADMELVVGIRVSTVPSELLGKNHHG